MPRLLIVDDETPGVELSGPEPSDAELVRAGRQALEARAVATLFRAIRDGFERQSELLRQAAKLVASLVVVLACGCLWQRADAAERMEREGEANGLALSAGRQVGSP